MAVHHIPLTRISLSHTRNGRLIIYRRKPTMRHATPSTRTRTLPRYATLPLPILLEILAIIQVLTLAVCLLIPSVLTFMFGGN